MIPLRNPRKPVTWIVVASVCGALIGCSGLNTGALVMFDGSADGMVANPDGWLADVGPDGRYADAHGDVGFADSTFDAATDSPADGAIDAGADVPFTIDVATDAGTNRDGGSDVGRLGDVPDDVPGDVTDDARADSGGATDAGEGVDVASDGGGGADSGTDVPSRADTETDVGFGIDVSTGTDSAVDVVTVRDVETDVRSTGDVGSDAGACTGVAPTVSVETPTSNEVIETCSRSGAAISFAFSANVSAPAAIAYVVFNWVAPDGSFVAPTITLDTAPYTYDRQVGGDPTGGVHALADFGLRGAWTFEVMAVDVCGHTSTASQSFTLTYTNHGCPNP